MNSTFYIENLAGLREKLARASRDGTRLGRVWDSVARRARNAPGDFPWFTPLVALVGGKPQDIENAKEAIRRYLRTLDGQSFGMGLHFHFWCFAFPHARWALYFQWLRALGAWEPEEERRLRAEFLTFQYVNFFSGMRTKPEPECVDNQALSLCFSNALIGHLFGGDSAIARRMAEDGLRRLPDMLGGFPPSGYSGEGSTYMDMVVGPSIPFVVELLERVKGGDWFGRDLPPHGGSAASVCRMIGREWLPCGLTLPWDHYGYHTPVRSCIAYAAHRTADPFYAGLLERQADWAVDHGIGWGYDDLPWSLVWWPETRGAAPAAFASWAEPEVGAALVSDDAELYLMQMWDESAPHYPTRAHVNPNALVLAAHGSPLTVDGIPDKSCTAFDYPDTWREVGYMDLGQKRKFNFGVGCAGGHAVLLVDGWEGMRAFSKYPQAKLRAFSEAEKSVTAEVTPLYCERWPDARAVCRRSRLCHERFWLIEDFARFDQSHAFTARFYLRPGRIPATRGVAIETAEGVRLHLLPILGSDNGRVETVAGYPERLDGASLRVDFTQHGSECRWLWLAWPEATRRVVSDEADGWAALPDAASAFDLDAARAGLAAAPRRLPFTQPPFLLSDLPVCRRWWFRKTIAVPTGVSWLRLPKRMLEPRLWIDGEEIDLAPHALRMALLEPEIALPPSAAGRTVEILLRCDTGHSQYAPGGNGGSGFSRRPALLVPQPASGVEHAEYRNGRVTVRAGGREWTVAHTLLED
ncbi:MAG TPA: hypothetical protein VMY35_18225 [Phycisphaerae bacterium]|nr:hypothetical protein [Phycisphaerae bacterium]